MTYGRDITGAYWLEWGRLSLTLFDEWYWAPWPVLDDFDNDPAWLAYFGFVGISWEKR